MAVSKRAKEEQLVRSARANDRTLEQQKELEARLDDMGPYRFFGLMRDLFGASRTMELTGWAAVWGLMGVESLGEMRKQYEAAGLSRSAAYRAAADFKVFADYVLEQTGKEVAMKDILRGLAPIVPSMG